ncbi:hypothetical protein Hdeb2414_s0021g00578561 [Helianthus debilis subsp. tardiflorus]
MFFGEGYTGKGDFKEDGVANMNVGIESMKTNDAGLVSADLKVSFSVDSGLEDFKAGCVVNLLINGLGSRVCSSELFSGQYGSVLKVLAKLAKQRDGMDLVMKEVGGRVKFPQLNLNVNVFDRNSGGLLECLDKRKKRSVRNEGLKVKASKVVWDDKSYLKVPVEGEIACKDEVLPDGASAHELVDDW